MQMGKRAGRERSIRLAARIYWRFAPCSGSRHRSLTFALFLDVRILDVSVTFEDGEVFACSDLGNGEVRGLTPVAHGFISFVDRTKIL